MTTPPQIRVVEQGTKDIQVQRKQDDNKISYTIIL